MTPENITSIKTTEQSLPSQVLESFKEIIDENNIGGCSCFYKRDIVSLMIEKGLKMEDIDKNNWLNDVVEKYRLDGWDAKHIQPEADDSPYGSYYNFKIPKNQI